MKNTPYYSHQQQNENLPVRKDSSQQNTKSSPTSSLKTPVTTSSRASKTYQTSARAIKSLLRSGRGSSSSSSRRTSFINPPAASNQISCANNRSASNLNGGDMEAARHIYQTSSGECDPDNLSPVAMKKILKDSGRKNRRNFRVGVR